MSKQGKKRRTRAERVAAREARSTLGYIQRIEREVQQELEDKQASETESK